MKQLYSKEILHQIKRAMSSLEESLQYLDKKYLPVADQIKTRWIANRCKR